MMKHQKYLFVFLLLLFLLHNDSLDLSQNKMLRILDCSENQLTSLDVSYNTALSSLKCSVNAITSLDLSNNPLLNEENVSAGKDVSIIYAK